MADKRRYIVVQSGACTLPQFFSHDCESVDLLKDTSKEIGPCAKAIMDAVEEIIMNEQDAVTVNCYKHGFPVSAGPLRNCTNVLPWEDVISFIVDDENERTAELALLKKGLECGGITHVYVQVGNSTPVCYTILQIGA